MSEIITQDVRNRFKQILSDELNNLPELLEQLEPKERLNFICKMMPYILPKIDSVDYTRGEPDNFSFKK